MSVIGSFDRKKLFAELNEPVATAEGWKSPAAQKAEALANLGAAASGDIPSSMSSDDITVAAFSGGGVTFAGGTLTEALQAIADATAAA